VTTGQGKHDAPYVFSGRRCLAVPASCEFEAPAETGAIVDVGEAARDALSRPIAARPLHELAVGAARVAVVVPDASRDCPVAMLLPPLLDELGRAGVHDEQIRIIVGCGLHRPTTRAEKTRLVGPSVAERVAVHDAQGIQQNSMLLGITPHGNGIWVNAGVATADLVVALGVVEPHLYAGFSGGVKAVAVGCAGEQTIAWTHHPVFIDQPAVRLCRLEGNPFQDALRQIAAAQRRLAEIHGPAWIRRHGAPFDLVVAGVPAPKDASIYQASRAATYVGLAARPAVVDGGLIVFCADVPLGAGDGPAEANFGALLAGAERPMELVERGCVEPLGPGGQRAYMMAKLMLRYRVGVVGDGDAELIRSLGMFSFREIGEAVAEARRVRGPETRTLAVADGLTTVVELAE
jgi:nickel-dependent lactate racemase